jgi:hypothetical protein
MNKQATSRKKLVLNKATVRHLTATELKEVGGGMINLSRVSECLWDCIPPDPEYP